MEAHFREVVLTAYLPDALASVRLPQYPNLVLCAVSLSFHGLWGWLNPKTNTPTGSNHRGHVTTHQRDLRENLSLERRSECLPLSFRYY